MGSSESAENESIRFLFLFFLRKASSDKPNYHLVGWLMETDSEKIKFPVRIKHTRLITQLAPNRYNRTVAHIQSG